jgi:hypothetical protein
MSPMTAFLIVTWMAIVVLFFALGAVWREIRLVRGLAMRSGADGYVSSTADISLGGQFASGGEPRIVVAADSGCPLCLAVIERLSESSVNGSVSVLTHEPQEVWQEVGRGKTGRLRVVTDPESWRAVSHLTPPVLMLVTGSGVVSRLVLPVSELEVDRVLADWKRRDSQGRSGGEIRHDNHT